jgi:hypothetical protein
MTLVKSAPKKVLAKKLFYQLKIFLSSKKIGFLGKTFFGLIKEKKFLFHSRVSVYGTGTFYAFCELKSP